MLQGLWLMLRRSGPFTCFQRSNEVFHFAAETVIALAKSGIDATSLKLNEENQILKTLFRLSRVLSDLQKCIVSGV